MNAVNHEIKMKRVHDQPIHVGATGFRSLTCAFMINASAQSISLQIEQLTAGPKHHFFGYIGQCQTVPWSGDGRFILAMEITQIDRMPTPDQAAAIILIDTRQNNEVIHLDQTHAWNPQQGTMFYWNPLAANTQFFFNDRDVNTGDVYTVLYDIETRKRIREYRDADAPIGNSGVAQNGGHPEWAQGHTMIGASDGRQILYDVDTRTIVGQLGNSEVFPKPEGDIALSPDGNWFANGYKQGNTNRYVIYRRSDGAYVRSKGLDKGLYANDIRIDPAPRWNRDSTAIVVPGIADDKTRQMFIIRVAPTK